jgi:hypothetical protein
VIADSRTTFGWAGRPVATQSSPAQTNTRPLLTMHTEYRASPNSVTQLNGVPVAAQPRPTETEMLVTHTGTLRAAAACGRQT